MAGFVFLSSVHLASLALSYISGVPALPQRPPHFTGSADAIHPTPLHPSSFLSVPVTADVHDASSCVFLHCLCDPTRIESVSLRPFTWETGSPGSLTIYIINARSAWSYDGMRQASGTQKLKLQGEVKRVRCGPRREVAGLDPQKLGH